MSGPRGSFSNDAAQALVEISHEACGVISGGVIVAANASAKVLGLSIGTLINDIIPATEYDDLIAACLSGQGPVRTACYGLRALHIEWCIKLVGDDAVFSARDVTSMMETADQIEDNIRKLQAAADEMEQFAYVASHDIQEPLRTITNYAGFLQQDYGTQLGDDGTQYIGAIVNSAKRCRELVRALLRYSQVGRGASFSWVDMNTEVRSAVEAQEFSIQDAKATVTCDPLPVVWGDHALLGAVFSNLISNALKFRRDSDLLVHIGARVERDHWLFWVSDTGRGIDSRFFDQIFKMFSRLDGNIPGVGVGLATSKKIISLHGGRIWPISEVGKGTTFFLTIARRHVDENPTCGGSPAGRHGGSASFENAHHSARPVRRGGRGVRYAVLARRGILLQPSATGLDSSRSEPPTGSGVRGPA